ncbi:hypothetical protein [Cysteiniphilum sp. JM-1]|uniref:hypothetical protein n=1 Tax=Cysteiniphilum sp. JM-1 TaxID=2610891 RepID=UPI001248E4B2|nr:hypothetical protein [Cysteiniphilum sp. JM-1]
MLKVKFQPICCAENVKYRYFRSGTTYEKSFKNQKLNFTNKGNALIFLELNGACKAQVDSSQESGVCLNQDGFTRLKVYPQQSIEIDVSNYQQSFQLSIVKADKRDVQRIELQS